MNRETVEVYLQQLVTDHKIYQKINGLFDGVNMDWSLDSYQFHGRSRSAAYYFESSSQQRDSQLCQKQLSQAGDWKCSSGAWKYQEICRQGENRLVDWSFGQKIN